MSRKQEILAEIARSRVDVMRDFCIVREELDVASKFRRCVRRRPLAWLGGAAAIGYILSGPKTRTVTKYVANKQAARSRPDATRPSGGVLSLSLAAAKFVLPIIRPALTAYLGKRLLDFAEKLTK